jgi:hypothetical protein
VRRRCSSSFIRADLSQKRWPTEVRRCLRSRPVTLQPVATSPDEHRRPGRRYRRPSVGHHIGVGQRTHLGVNSLGAGLQRWQCDRAKTCRACRRIQGLPRSSRRLCVEGETTAGREAAWLEAPSQYGTCMRGRCVAHIQPIGERANHIGHGSETNGIGHNLRYSENAAHRIIDWPPKSRTWR